MGDSTINWGILGLGKIARKFADDLIRVSGCRLLAAGSRNQSKADDFAAAYQVPFAFGSYEQLVNHDELDVIYIASPHTLHKEHALMALDAGKHVLCEKPFAINVQEVDEMIRVARSKNLFLMEAIWTRFFPFMLKALELVDEGVIGEIKIIEADFGFKAPYEPEGRLYNPQLGGGALLDIGIYPIFLVLALLGPPDEIQAIAHMSNTGIDTATVMNFRWNQGQLANLHCCITAETLTQAKIFGSEGSITVPSRWHEAKELNLNKDNKIKTFDFQDPFRGFAYEIMEVNHCIRQGLTESKILPLSFSRSLMKTMDIVRKQIDLVYPADV